MTVVGMPVEWARKLLQVATGQDTLTEQERKLALDELARLQPKLHRKTTFPKPTGTAQKITVDKSLEQASSVSATPSWTVSHG